MAIRIVVIAACVGVLTLMAAEIALAELAGAPASDGATPAAVSRPTPAIVVAGRMSANEASASGALKAIRNAPTTHKRKHEPKGRHRSHPIAVGK